MKLTINAQVHGHIESVSAKANSSVSDKNTLSISFYTQEVCIKISKTPFLQISCFVLHYGAKVCPIDFFLSVIETAFSAMHIQHFFIPLIALVHYVLWRSKQSHYFECIAYI